MNPLIVIEQLLLLMLIMLLGYIVARMKLLDEHAEMNFATFINYVSVPALILSSADGAGITGSKMDSIWVLVVSSASYAFFAFLALGLPKLFRAKPDEVGVLQFVTVFANNGFMGLPVVQAIFGSGGLFYAAIFNIPNNILVYSLGVYFISKGKRTHAIDLRKLLLNPAILSAILALLIFLFEIPVPSLIMKTAASLGNITSPLAMFIIGMSMVRIDIWSAMKDLRLYLFSILRMLVIPALMWFVLRNVISNTVILGVLIIIAGMPGPAMAVTLSTLYGGNTSLATRYIFISTFLSVLTIPLLSLLFG
ncbi:AEC family transporter [Jeotgalibaca sp. A127]|uniref:AEC family transporter n=1 Tax=Jeotgalibaca sp. A127 TaxID=3457324 RepID=UPI003FD289A1